MSTIEQQKAALDRVRRRVLAIGFFAITIHGVVGLVVVAHVVLDQGRQSHAAVLLVMSAFVAAVQYVGCRLILKAPLWSPWWILVSAIPTIVGVVML